MVATTAQRARALLLGSLLAPALVLAPGTSPASAYPEQTCQVGLDTQTVRVGATLEVTGTLVPVPADAASWSWDVSFAGQAASSGGAAFRHEFVVPRVTKATVEPVRAVARHDDVVCTRTLDVRISPGHVAPPATLPDTGGPTLWMLAAGMVLVAVGIAASWVGRHRS